jgi:hypothetical protein
MDKLESINMMTRLSRSSISPKLARDICAPWGVKLDKKLIRTGRQSREIDYAPGKQRVNVSAVAEHICLELGHEPDPELMRLSSSMFGIGSMHDLSTKACLVVLQRLV